MSNELARNNLTKFNKNPDILIPLGLVSLLGVFVILALTARRGAGIIADVPSYILIARHMFSPGFSGASHLSGVWQQHYPPLFPFFLAVIHCLGGPDPLIGVRWLNALLFGVSIFLVGMLTYKYSQAGWLALLAAGWMLVKIDILRIYSAGMSEPLFIVWLLLYMMFVVDFICHKRPTAFWGMTVTAALACMTRIIGVSLVFTGFLVLLYYRNKDTLNPLAPAAIFFSLSLVPIIGWMVKNFCNGGRVVDRSFAFHPWALTSHFRGGGTWPINHFHPSLIPLIFICVLTLLGAIIWRAKDPLAMGNMERHKHVFLHTVILFVGIYLLIWAITVIFVDASGMITRYFIPIQILGILFALSAVGMLFSSMKGYSIVKFIFAVLCLVYLIGLNSIQAASWSLDRYENGLEYDGKTWDNSEIIRAVKQIPESTIIYTNDFDAIYTLANRQPVPIQPKISMESLQKNPRYDGMMKEMRHNLYDKRGVIVYCSLEAGGRGLPTMDELQKQMPLKLILRVSDGAIYTWDRN
jgi:hypothetical protein